MEGRYQDQAQRTEAPVDGDMRLRASEAQTVRLLHAATGMCTETGEFFDQLKRHIFYGQPLDTTNLKEEIGDICWYIALGCNALNADLTLIMQTNIDKLRKRFPEKFTQHHAAEENRDRGGERSILEDKITFTVRHETPDEEVITLSKPSRSLEDYAIAAGLGDTDAREILINKAKEVGLDHNISFKTFDELVKKIRSKELENEMTEEAQEMLGEVELPAPEPVEAPELADVYRLLLVENLCPFCKAHVSDITAKSAVKNWNRSDQAIVCGECRRALNIEENYIG